MIDQSNLKKGELTGFSDRCRESFRCWAHNIAVAAGTHWAFMVAAGLIVLWAVTGPLFDFSDTWQLVINTATTIITFLMVFLIQNTQNRDTRAIQLKLDELLRGVEGARTRLVSLETLTDAELDDLEKEFEKLRSRAASSREFPKQGESERPREPAGSAA